MFIKTMNTIAVMLLQDIENDLLDISSTQTSFADSFDSDSSKFKYVQINFVCSSFFWKNFILIK